MNPKTILTKTLVKVMNRGMKFGEENPIIQKIDMLGSIERIIILSQQIS
jgi:hypothetical protein